METPKTLKYAELIAQSEESSATAQNDIAVREAELELKGHKITLDKALITAKSNVLKAKAAKPFSTRTVYMATVEVDKLEREIKAVTDLEKELF